MLSGSSQDDDSIFRISFDLFHSTNHVVHELKADGIRAVGTIQRQVADSVLAIENYRFVFHTALHRLHCARIAAVNRDSLSGDPARRIGAQKQNHVGRILWLSNALDLVDFQHPLYCFGIRGSALDSRRARRAECDTVGGDSRATEVLGDGSHEARGARLGARINLEMRLAHPAGIRNHGDDFAVLVGDHFRSGDAHAVQHAEEVGAEEGLPVLRLLLPEGFARDGARIGAGVARVVHKDIDFAECRARFLKHGSDGSKTGYVALRGDRLDPQLFNFGGYSLSALEAEIVDDYATCIVFGEAECNGTSDALSRTGHQADASFEIGNVTAQVVSSRISVLGEYGRLAQLSDFRLRHF